MKNSVFRFVFFISVGSFSNPLLAFDVESVVSSELNTDASVLITVSGSGFGSEPRKITLNDKGLSQVVVKSGELQKEYSQSDLWLDSSDRKWSKALVPQKIPLENKNVFSDSGYFLNGSSFNEYYRPIEDLRLDQLLVVWDYLPMQDPTVDGGSNKFIRIWDEHSGNNSRISWTQMHLTASTVDIDHEATISWNRWGGEVGKWNKMYLWVDGKNGLIEAYINGEKLHQVTDFILSPTAEKGLNVKRIGWDQNISTNYSGMTGYIANIYVSDSNKSVVVSPHEEWASAKGNFTPLPVKSWTDSSISFLLSEEARSKNFFIYFLDGMGSFNNKGFCVNCPSPPQKLGVD
jgi:hypothetical protein